MQWGCEKGIMLLVGMMMTYALRYDQPTHQPGAKSLIKLTEMR